MDKLLIKIGKPKKVLYLLNRGGCGPVSDSCCLLRVHLDLALGDSEPHEKDFSGMEVTFLRFHIKMAPQKVL